MIPARASLQRQRRRPVIKQSLSRRRLFESSSVNDAGEHSTTSSVPQPVAGDGQGIDSLLLKRLACNESGATRNPCVPHERIIPEDPCFPNNRQSACVRNRDNSRSGQQWRFCVADDRQASVCRHRRRFQFILPDRHNHTDHGCGLSLHRQQARIRWTSGIGADECARVIETGSLLLCDTKGEAPGSRQ